jgi:hypothetical protein
MGKMQGWSATELCITLAFLCSVGSCGARITLLNFLVLLVNVLIDRHIRCYYPNCPFFYDTRNGSLGLIRNFLRLMGE